MTERRKRLIEVAFPLEEVSQHSRLDPYQGAPHPRALHKWWAQRPLAACRAFIYGSLVDDPPNEAEREELLREVADLASWDAVRKPDTVVRQKEKGGSGLTGRELLRRARERILRDNDGKPPRLLDPFAGGGAIPLEALRLGCEVEASDLNPVAVLILKGTVEHPQKYGRPLAEQRERRPDDCAGVDGQVPQYIRDSARSLQGSFAETDAVAAYEKNPLAADVRYWGNWMLEKARKELAPFYPPDPDGSVPVAYLWSRTVPCPNCHLPIPLIHQYWLGGTGSTRVALAPAVASDGVPTFGVLGGDEGSALASGATTSGGDASCLSCGQVVKGKEIRRSAREGHMDVMLLSVVLEADGRPGKGFRAAARYDIEAATNAGIRLRTEETADGDRTSFVPDEPIATGTLGLRVDQFGLERWRDLFSDRQLLLMGTLSRKVREAYALLRSHGLSASYSSAVSTYLAFVVDRLLREHCSLARWNPTGQKAQAMFSQQVVSMVGDYAEVHPFGGSVGDIASAIEMVAACVELSSELGQGAVVSQRAAQHAAPTRSVDLVLTDPPYYAAVDYAGLSDFFYVWLKRSLAPVDSELLSMPLTPKRDQAIMASESRNETERQRYLDLMQQSFANMRGALSVGGLTGVVFASIEPDAWATLIEGLLRAHLVPDASWPIDTESQSKLSSSKRATLKTSVWMACRPRHPDAGPAFLGDLQDELRREVESKLLDFWRRGIRGADFFISAIGPALAVYGRHTKVLRPDGTEVTVRDFLDIVRRESTRVALQQVLGGESLGVIDSVTQTYVTWAWSHGKASLDAGEAIALCLATGADLDEFTRPHSAAEMVKEKSKKVVKLRSIAARAREDDELGHGNGARTTPLIDQLQHAAWLWGANRTADLAKYRAELGEPRWKALRVLSQAVAECLPEGDDDRRLVNGMLGSSVTAGAAAPVLSGTQARLELDQ